jgi:hypothetical protein
MLPPCVNGLKHDRAVLSIAWPYGMWDTSMRNQ